MYRFPLFFLFLFFAALAQGQGIQAFEIYNHKGRAVKFARVLKEARKADIIFFGELHNNPIAHWLQLELTKALYASEGGQLVLGAEMFEADGQALLNDYLAGRLSAEAFEEKGNLWSNYTTDYRPLVDFARDNQLPFVATNVPRSFARIVFQSGFEGLDTLSEQDKQYLAPLPIAFDINLPSYQAMQEMMSAHGGGSSENFPKAQAIKDATMAHFIAENWKEGQTFVHFNGSYHSDDYEGIIWYLRRLLPEASILSITTVEQEGLKRLKTENKGKADFTVGVIETMTKTY